MVRLWFYRLFRRYFPRRHFPYFYKPPTAVAPMDPNRRRGCVHTRWPDNAPGRYWVSDKCLDYDCCRDALPQVFVRHPELGYSYVARQPRTPEEERIVQELIEVCPVEAIRDEGDTNQSP